MADLVSLIRRLHRTRGSTGKQRAERLADEIPESLGHHELEVLARSLEQPLPIIRFYPDLADQLFPERTDQLERAFDLDLGRLPSIRLNYGSSPTGKPTMRRYPTVRPRSDFSRLEEILRLRPNDPQAVSVETTNRIRGDDFDEELAASLRDLDQWSYPSRGPRLGVRPHHRARKPGEPRPEVIDDWYPRGFVRGGRVG